MHPKLVAVTCGLVACAVLVGCGGDGSTGTGGVAGAAGGAATGGASGAGGTAGNTGSGGSVDAGPDVDIDAAAGGSDATTDAADAAVDASNDVVLEGSAEASDDAALDGSADASDDAALDGSADASDDASLEASADASADAAGDSGADACNCEAGQACEDGGCVPIATCQSNNDCSFDRACVLDVCTPWSSVSPSYDPACTHVPAVGVLAPIVRCEFSTPPPGDPYPQNVNVQNTPIVATFDGSLVGPASIAATFAETLAPGYTEDRGVIRVLSGADCSLQQNLGGGSVTSDWIVSSATLAAADMDGDGAPELVAFTADGGMIAFTLKAGVWSVLWKAPRPSGAPWSPCNTTSHRCPMGWTGPSLHDLDDDGLAEVIREGVVFGHDGSLLSMQPSGYASTATGLFAVLADLDSDSAVEFANGAAIWQWQAGAWATDSGFADAGSTLPGRVAIADFGAYGSGATSDPELVVVSNGSVTIRALDGTLAMPPVAVPGNGGGPPTVADFDGDGLPEVGVAGLDSYTVFDIDCGPTPRSGGVCAQGPCDFASPSGCPASGYIAWSRATLDSSSSVTGSSAFDFDGDGKSEVVFADECFTRVYDGSSGAVLLSQYRSSCTWVENPVVADVNGNRRADLVVPSNDACSIACTLDANGADPEFVGARCSSGADCPSKACDQGYCRCTTTAGCCSAADNAACTEAGWVCAPPPAGTPGAGNTCRAGHPRVVTGIRVYSDLHDQWIGARRIWNQHAYAVTNVNDDGTVPRTSAWQKNWSAGGPNDFRQNVSGMALPLSIGDPTAGITSGASCQSGQAVLAVDVCNRGSAAIGVGLPVGFRVGSSEVCTATTSTVLDPGACESVTCTWASPPTGASPAATVDVVVDEGQAMTECNTGNDMGRIDGVHCP